MNPQNRTKVVSIIVAVVIALAVIPLIFANQARNGNVNEKVEAIATAPDNTVGLDVFLPDSPSQEFGFVCPGDTTESVRQRLGEKSPIVRDANQTTYNLIAGFSTDGVMGTFESPVEEIDFCSKQLLPGKAPARHRMHFVQSPTGTWVLDAIVAK